MRTAPLSAGALDGIFAVAHGGEGGIGGAAAPHHTVRFTAGALAGFPAAQRPCRRRLPPAARTAGLAR